MGVAQITLIIVGTILFHPKLLRRYDYISIGLAETMIMALLLQRRNSRMLIFSR